MSLRAPRATKVAAAPKAGSLASVDSLEGAFRRLLSHPPDQPLVHVDHSRRVEPAPRMHPPAAPTDVYYLSELKGKGGGAIRHTTFHPGKPGEAYGKTLANNKRVYEPMFMIAQASEDNFKFWGFADPRFKPYEPADVDPDEGELLNLDRRILTVPTKASKHKVFTFEHSRNDVRVLPQLGISANAYADLTFVLDDDPRLSDFKYKSVTAGDSGQFCMYEIDHEGLSDELLRDLLERLEWQTTMNTKEIEKAKKNYVSVASNGSAEDLKVATRELRNVVRENVFKDGWLRGSEAKDMYGRFCSAVIFPADARSKAYVLKATQDETKEWQQEVEVEFALKGVMERLIAKLEKDERESEKAAEKQKKEAERVEKVAAKAEEKRKKGEQKAAEEQRKKDEKAEKEAAKAQTAVEKAEEKRKKEERKAAEEQRKKDEKAEKDAAKAERKEAADAAEIGKVLERMIKQLEVDQKAAEKQRMKGVGDETVKATKAAKEALQLAKASALQDKTEEATQRVKDALEVLKGAQEVRKRYLEESKQSKEAERLAKKQRERPSELLRSLLPDGAMPSQSGGAPAAPRDNGNYTSIDMGQEEDNPVRYGIHGLAALQG